MNKKNYYINYSYIITVFLLISLVNGDCPNIVTSYYDEARCDSDMKNIVNAQISINNFYQYKNITSYPSVLQQTIQNGYLVLKMDYDIEYTITLSNPDCPDQKIIQRTPNSPRLIVTQPKCQNSLAIIQFNSDYLHQNQTLYINDTVIQSPYEMLFTGPYQYSFNTLNSNGDPDCLSTFIIQPSNIIKNPQLQIIHTTCGINGKIIVSNVGDYLSIVLLNSQNKTIQTSTIGNYDGLLSDSYSLYLISNQCGKQLYSVVVQDIPPTYQMLLIDDSCPTKPTIDISLTNTSYLYSVIVNEALVPSRPFTFINGQDSIQLNINSCGIYSINGIVPYSYPPIQYSISNFDFCKNDYSIQLYYDTKLIPNNSFIQIVSKMERQISLDPKTNSFNATLDDIYYIKSNCYTESIYIEAPKRKPYYSISTTTKTNYCNELVDITISNYLDFTKLYLFTGDQFRNNSFYPINGIFKQIPNQSYKLYYNYRGCFDNFLSINNNNNNSSANVQYFTKLITPPTCGNPNGGIAQVTVIDNFTNKQLYQFNQSISYDWDSPFNTTLMSIDKLSCTMDLSLHFVKQDTQFLIKNVSQFPICKFSNQGLNVTITPVESTVSIEEISINGQKVSISNFYILQPGNNSIEIKSKSQRLSCEPTTIYYYVDSLFPQFQVEYDIITVDDCIEGLGGFTIKDYTKYQSLSIDSSSLITKNGSTGYNYPSGFYDLDFSIQLGDVNQICSGTVKIFVSSSINVTLSYQIVQQPLCINDNSGVIVFSNATDKFNKVYPIEYIDGNQQSYRDGLSAGSHSINVKSGSCSWNINVEIDPINVIIKPVLQGSFTDECVTSSTYLLTYSNPLADLTSIVDGIIDSNIKNYITIVETDLNFKSNIVYGFNGQCSQTLMFKVGKQPMVNSINYKISNLNGDIDCINSISTFDIQVLDDLNDYESLTYNGLLIDSNGYFRNVRLGYSILGKLFNSNCILETPVVYDHLIQLDKQILNETCQESINGEISILNNSTLDSQKYYYLIQYDGSYFSPVLLEIDPLLVTFGYLAENEYSIIRVQKNHPSCFSNDSIFMGTMEPQLNIDINYICNHEATINVYPNNNQNLTGYYIFNNSNSFTGVSNGLNDGNYLVQYTITSDHCKRNFGNFIQIQNSKCDNLGLKIGLPIGLFFFLVFCIVGVVLYIKMKKPFIKVNDIPAIQHKKSTFKLYTGNKVVELDKF